MFGTNTISRGLTFGKVLNGLSKGLTIANQAIPIYEQVKPMLGNAKKLFSLVKEFKNTPWPQKGIKNNTNVRNNTIKKEDNFPLKSSSSISLPVFFQ